MIIRSANGPGFDRVIVDESFGRFNGLKIVASTGTGGDNIVVNGSAGEDAYTALPGGFGANIDMGGPTGSELTSTTAGTITFNGNGGHDTLNGGLFGFHDATIPLQMNGGAGPDSMSSGRSGRDVLDGGPDADVILTGQGLAGDRAIGGFGPGDTVVADTGDTVSGFESGGIGGAKPGSVRARSGKTASVRLSWTHPTSWKKLDSLTLDAHDGKKKVGAVELAPLSGRMAARGDVELVGHGPLSRKGKTVSVDLELEFADRLDGKKLDLRMQPEDRGTSGR